MNSPDCTELLVAQSAIELDKGRDSSDLALPIPSDLNKKTGLSDVRNWIWEARINTQFIESNDSINRSPGSDVKLEYQSSGEGLLLCSATAAATRDLRCWVPCDHVPVRSWPLLRARQLMRDVIESFKQEQAS